MTHPHLTYDAIEALLYQHVLSGCGKDNCDKQLEWWASLSPYNRSVLNDVQHETRLRENIINAYYSDPTQFWNVLISYRAALGG